MVVRIAGQKRFDEGVWRRERKLLSFADKMIDGYVVLSILPPSPFFSDVIPILEPHDQLVFMTHGELREVTCPSELKNQLLYIIGLWHCTHPRLVVGRA